MTDNINTQIPPPNYTQVPNLILDNIHLLSDVELRVMLVACRQTFGWHRQSAPLSIGYLEAKTGKSKQGVRNGVQKSTTRKWLKKVGTGKRGVSIYGLNFADLSTELTGTSQLSRQVLVNSVDTVKKDKESLKKKDLSPAKPEVVSDLKLKDMTPTELTVLKRDMEQPTPGVLEDHNLHPVEDDLCEVPPGNAANVAAEAPSMREIVEDIKDHAQRTGQPHSTGTRFSFGANGIEKEPLTVENSKPKRIVAPANIKADTVETSQEVPPREYDITQKEMYTAICEVLGWDASKKLPGKMASRVGKAAKQLREVEAPLWKMGKMQKWAMKKYGDKWNFPFNIGSPEKVVINWPTYCGETIGEDTITTVVPLDPSLIRPVGDGPPVSPEQMQQLYDRTAEVAEQMTIKSQPVMENNNVTSSTTDYTEDEKAVFNKYAPLLGIPLIGDDDPLEPGS